MTTNRERLFKLVVEDYKSFIEEMKREGMTPDHAAALDSLPEEDDEPDTTAEVLQAMI